MLTSAVALSPGSCAQQPQVQPSLGGSGQGALRSSLTKSHLVPALARWCCALALLARTQSGSCACQEVQQLSLFLDMAHTNANYRLSLPGLSATPGSCAAPSRRVPHVPLLGLLPALCHTCQQVLEPRLDGHLQAQSLHGPMGMGTWPCPTTSQPPSHKHPVDSHQ